MIHCKALKPSIRAYYLTAVDAEAFHLEALEGVADGHYKITPSVLNELSRVTDNFVQAADAMVQAFEADGWQKQDPEVSRTDETFVGTRQAWENKQITRSILPAAKTLCAFLEWYQVALADVQTDRPRVTAKRLIKDIRNKERFENACIKRNQGLSNDRNQNPFEPAVLGVAA